MANLVGVHIDDAYQEFYSWYCKMHRGYEKVEEEVKRLERAVLAGQPLSLEAFSKAVREKHEAIKRMHEADFYCKELKRLKHEQREVPEV